MRVLFCGRSSADRMRFSRQTATVVGLIIAILAVALGDTVVNPNTAAAPAAPAPAVDCEAVCAECAAQDALKVAEAAAPKFSYTYDGYPSELALHPSFPPEFVLGATPSPTTLVVVSDSCSLLLGSAAFAPTELWMELGKRAHKVVRVCRHESNVTSPNTVGVTAPDVVCSEAACFDREEFSTWAAATVTSLRASGDIVLMLAAATYDFNYTAFLPLHQPTLVVPPELAIDCMMGLSALDVSVDFDVPVHDNSDVIRRMSDCYVAEMFAFRQLTASGGAVTSAADATAAAAAGEASARVHAAVMLAPHVGVHTSLVENYYVDEGAIVMVDVLHARAPVVRLAQADAQSLLPLSRPPGPGGFVVGLLYDDAHHAVQQVLLLKKTIKTILEGDASNTVQFVALIDHNNLDSTAADPASRLSIVRPSHASAKDIHAFYSGVDVVLDVSLELQGSRARALTALAYGVPAVVPDTALVTVYRSPAVLLHKPGRWGAAATQVLSVQRLSPAARAELSAAAVQYASTLVGMSKVAEELEAVLAAVKLRVPALAVP